MASCKPSSRFDWNDSRQLIAEQEIAYQESLAADRKKKEEKEKKEREEKQRKEQEESEALRIASCLSELEETRRQLAETVEEMPAKGVETVRVKLQYPNGKTKARVFGVDNYLEDLFNFAIVSPDCPPYCSLYTSFPKMPIRCIPEWYFAWRVEAEQKNLPPPPDGRVTYEDLTFREKGLTKPFVVMVQDDSA